MTDCSFAAFNLMEQEGYEEHMAPRGEFIVHFLNLSITYSCFVYRLSSYINERLANYCCLTQFDLVEHGGCG